VLIQEPSSHLQRELQVRERQLTTKEGTNRSQVSNKVRKRKGREKEETAKHRSYLN
jgi:hypothetical protein